MEPTDATIDILKKIQSSIAQLRDRMDSGFSELRTRADAQGQQLQSQGKQLQSQAQRLGAIERRIGELVEVTTLSVTRHLDLTHRMDAIESRVDVLEGR